MLSAFELDRIRKLVDREGVDKAAAALDVHKESILRALAGLDVRPNTERALKDSLERGLDK